MEVPGKKSHLDVSCDGSNGDDEDFYCDPCENEGERQPAKGFCVDCQEYLCSSCFTIHRRPAVWHHHVLLDKDAMPKTKTKEQLNYECTEPCVEHSTKIIEYYCQTHNHLGCPVCITGNHRKCNDVDYIPHIAEQYRDSSEINEIFESLESLQEETDKHTATANNDKLKVAAYENSAKAQVLQLRDEFNSICDRLLEDIETVKSSDESKIKNSTAKYEEISKKIKTHTAAMEKKRSEMKVSQLFTEAKLSKLSVEELAKEVKLARETASIRHYEMTFNVEELRDGLKLTFHDNEIENAITEFECHSPSEYQNKLARNSTRPEAERPPFSQGQGTQQYAKPKEKRHILRIVDPNSGKDVTAEIRKTTPGSTEVTRSSDSGSRTMFGENAKEPQGQSGESNAIAAQFAALVAAKLYHPPDAGSPPSYTPSRPQQQQFFQPRQQNIYATPSLSFEIQYPNPGTRPAIQMMPPPKPKMIYDDMGIQSNQFSGGMPYSYLGPAQYPHPEGWWCGPTYGNQPPFMGIKTAYDQSGRDVAAESHDSNSSSHTIEISKVGGKLNDLIVKNKEENEAVIEWIDSNVDATARKQPRFIRDLMTVICINAIKGNKGQKKLESRVISARSDLFKRYINEDSDHELQALYAVQALISKLGHPNGVLRAIFETFYGEDLISEDVLWQWQRSKDEPAGKEECLKQTIPFFTWLKEAKDDYM